MSAYRSLPEQLPCLDKSRSHCLFRLGPVTSAQPSFTCIFLSFGGRNVACQYHILNLREISGQDKLAIVIQLKIIIDYSLLWKFTPVKVIQSVPSHSKRLWKRAFFGVAKKKKRQGAGAVKTSWEPLATFSVKVKFLNYLSVAPCVMTTLSIPRSFKSCTTALSPPGHQCPYCSLEWEDAGKTTKRPVMSSRHLFAFTRIISRL